jgi:hypothetical protein
MKSLILILLLALPLAAGAATYSWTDEAGTVHFTDNPGSVPKKFRKKIRLIDNEQALPPVTVPEQKTEESRQIPVTAPAQPNSITTAPVSKTTRFGEHTAEEWQKMFRTLRDQITTIEQQFEQIKREAGDGKSMLTRQQIDELNAQNKKLYGEHEALRLRFNRLVEEANAAGLPPEFGQ